MYKSVNGNTDPNKLVCPECQGNRFRINHSKVECVNCGWEASNPNYRGNKYGAKRQEFNGKLYDSKFEAATAQSLELRKLGKDILDYDTQYKIEAMAYRSDGVPAFMVKHKVDFRIHHHDGSYELLEAKGIETDDYKWRRKFLEHIWLPEHPDHTYTVVKQHKR